MGDDTARGPGETPPAARDFPIADFGARPGADCTDAVARAVAACSAAGGGRVVVGPGRHRTGPVRLRSDVELHLAAGATLAFDPDPAAHPTVLTRWQGIECQSYAPLVYALDARNVAVTGPGTLDGGADDDHWWCWSRRWTGGRDPGAAEDWRRLLDMVERGVPVEDRVLGPGHRFRPSFVQPYRCRDVLIADVRIVNAPMWVVHPVLSRDVTVRDVTVVSRGPNNDGCNPDSCSGVRISGCVFDTGDDCVAIKSGRDADGRRVGVPCEDVVIEDCTFADGHGGVTIGSEMSGGVRHVRASGLRMVSPRLDNVLRIKASSHRGGVVEDVRLTDAEVDAVRGAVVSIDLRHADDTVTGRHHPVLRGVSVAGLRVGRAQRTLLLRGSEHSEVSGVSLDDVRVGRTAARDVVEHAAGLRATGVVVGGVERPAPAGPR